jgi:hypothetical protein
MPRRRSFAVAINLFSWAVIGIIFRFGGSGKIAKRGSIASLQFDFFAQRKAPEFGSPFA